MKKIYVLLIVLFIFCRVSAQITITTSDLPNALDTFRVSTGQAFSGMDPTLTGPNMSWDYSQLTSTGQQVDSFLTVGSTATVYSIVFFDNVINPNRANHAVRGPSFGLGTQVSVDDVFNFYFNSSSVYKQVGFGAAVNAATIPVIYSPHDVIYNLPLQFGADDSSASGYELDLTSTLGLYYKVNRTRHTVADGWGTLTTPYGTFNALRVLSTISERDSIYIDSLSFGFTTPAVITKEYKWLGTGEGIPLLQINTTNNGVVTQITYKDSLPGSTTGMPDQIAANPIRSLFPNPAAGASVLNIDLRQASLVKIQVLDGTGQVVYQSPEQKMDAGNHFSLLNNETQKLNAGTYFVRLFVDGKTSMQKLIVVE